MKGVTIVDYGVGNLQSVARAIESCGGKAIVTSTPAMVEEADRLLLPGVGAFGDGMKGLRDRGLVESIRRFGDKGRPFLGICLGMQMLMESSDEFGRNEGLKFVRGQCVRVPDTGVDGTPHKIPHIGWNPLLKPDQSRDWSETPLKLISEGEEVYFVHSWMAAPVEPAHVLAVTMYDGRPVTAAIQRDNLFGCQFHPEKSGPAGLKIIKSFLSI